VWTSGGHRAHFAIVLARTSPLDPEHRHAGFSQFIVALDSPGVTISPIVTLDGHHHFNEVTFAEVRVGDNDVLGQVGDGWHQVTAELGFERSGPERILSTAILIFGVIRALGPEVDDRTATAVGDLLGRAMSLRQLSVAVARDLAAGRDAATRAALVKDLGTRFEQESVELCADLLESVDDPGGLRAVLDTARLHSPMFTLRGGTNEVLRGVIARGLGVR
jgi:acyl-CoA dehydrogenase